MPLLTSPIDGSPMKEIERYGIKLDLCPASGGVWFDKGEVEKLIHYVQEETAKEAANDAVYDNAQSMDMRDHKPNRNYLGRKKRERENPLSDLFDMFEL